MTELTLAELDRESPAFDRAVLASGDIDHFCSSTDWGVPAAEALLPGRPTLIARLEGGYLAMAQASHPGGTVLQPLEAMWGLGCPVVGADAFGLARQIASLLERRPKDAIMVGGLGQRSARLSALVRALVGRYELGLGAVTRRFVASLDGGTDGFLRRRTASFRVALKRARRRGQQRGLSFLACPIAPGGAEAAFERVLAVEAKSWKGLQGVGIAASTMMGFYRAMTRRLAERGGVRLMFAKDADGRDVAYILGGVLGDTYRGLQFSFEAGFEDCSLGNLCQYHQIAALCEEGVRRYDLGAEVEYKRRWGEQAHETVTLIGLPR